MAQTVQASLGIVPAHALAFGVEVQYASIRLRVQLSQVTQKDADDISDIVSELEVLLGPGVVIESVSEVMVSRLISPDDGICWTFLSRVD